MPTRNTMYSMACPPDGIMKLSSSADEIVTVKHTIDAARPHAAAPGTGRCLSRFGKSWQGFWRGPDKARQGFGRAPAWHGAGLASNALQGMQRAGQACGPRRCV